MKNTNVAKGVNIIQFVNLREKDKRYNTFQELISDGLVTNYKFIYTNPTENNSKKYLSTRIVKMDLYNKIITTSNGKKFKILNEIEVNPKRKVEV